MEVFYYPRTSRRILIALLDMFNNIKVYNYNTNGSPVSIIDVPIKFGPSEKYHLFDMQMESGKKYYPKIPSLLLSLDNISYDSNRSTSVNEQRSFYNPALKTNYADDFWTDVQPSPYNYSYSLEVRTESMDHLFQILENILPFFNPSNHLKIKEFEFLNLERNIAVHLEGVNMEYPKEMSEDESRYFNSTISFNVHGYMYRPIDYQKIIKFIKVNYLYDGYNSEFYDTSAFPSSAIAPEDFSFSATNGKNTLYTKVSDTDVTQSSDNMWDGGIGDIDEDKKVFTKPQPVNEVGKGIGTYPDEGVGNINNLRFTFTDGTYADGKDL